MTDAPHAQLFTLNIWQENLGDGCTEWRGKVRHVPSGETRYFRDWPTLIAFLEAAGIAPVAAAGSAGATSEGTLPLTDDPLHT